MVSEARKQSMAWMETDYSKHTYFRWKVKWRLEHLGALGTTGDTASLRPLTFVFKLKMPVFSLFPRRISYFQQQMSLVVFHGSKTRRSLAERLSQDQPQCWFSRELSLIVSGIVIKIIISRLNWDSFQTEVLNQGSRHVKKRTDSHGVRARAVSVLRLDRIGQG